LTDRCIYAYNSKNPIGGNYNGYPSLAKLYMAFFHSFTWFFYFSNFAG